MYTMYHPLDCSTPLEPAVMHGSLQSSSTTVAAMIKQGWFLELPELSDDEKYKIAFDEELKYLKEKYPDCFDADEYKRIAKSKIDAGDQYETAEIETVALICEETGTIIDHVESDTIYDPAIVGPDITEPVDVEEDEEIIEINVKDVCDSACIKKVADVKALLDALEIDYDINKPRSILMKMKHAVKSGKDAKEYIYETMCDMIGDELNE